MVKRLVHGSPFKHPLHPALIHYPIGLFTLSVFFDILFLIQNGAVWMTDAALYTLGGGIVMGLIAAIPGLVDWSEIRSDHPGKKEATFHMLLNLSAVTLFIISLVIRLADPDQGNGGLLPILISIGGLLVLLFSGYLGGKLVYDQGIGVGRYRRPTNLPDRTIKAGHAPNKNEYIAVADEVDLKDGETLRVEINGEVMAVARHEGKVYAFNEFCTHRFGPLSEGPITKGEVECPWHRSCFDIRTGKVVSGPAKIELKTYEVRVRKGKIEIRAAGNSKKV
jgi:nitrite reductase/ring-hydroxylating ferredoxin subunit/uncharacterized membrane protein